MSFLQAESAERHGGAPCLKKRPRSGVVILRVAAKQLVDRELERVEGLGLEALKQVEEGKRHALPFLVRPAAALLMLCWTGCTHPLPSNFDAGDGGSATGADGGSPDGWQDIRWELEPLGATGTRLTLWHNINKGFISMGAAGWHICFDVLDQLIAGEPLGRIVGPDTMKFGWPRLNAEYAKQFGVETPSLPAGR